MMPIGPSDRIMNHEALLVVACYDIGSRLGYPSSCFSDITDKINNKEIQVFSILSAF